jgi:hypothetical protein
MRNTENGASREEIVMRARLRSWRRARRLDVLLASTLLLLLIFGWAARWVSPELWPRGDHLTAGRSSHV